MGNLLFIWRVQPGASEGEILTKSAAVIGAIQKDMPKYHTRQMRKVFCDRFFRLCPNVQPAVLHSIYQEFSGDNSASNTNAEKLVDECIKFLLSSDDPDLVWDLRLLNEGQKGKYDLFWEKCERFFEESALAAADERRHNNVTHLATAMSAKDLHKIVSSRLPEDAPKPSVKWLLLQFWPKDRTRKAAVHHTGRLKIRFAIQSRQHRASHPDQHYAGALFRYLHEFAVHFREHSTLAFVDDKHSCKVGDPGHPLAAVERGKKVLVALGKTFTVSDHDFSKCSLIPSVCLVCDIPSSIGETFFAGQVNIGLKDSALEASSPLRHATELQAILQRDENVKPILLLYSDGGPDHRVTY